MPEEAKIYRGRALHSDWNEATAECTMRVLAGSLRGECESGLIEMPVQDLAIESTGGKRPQFWFTHPQLPGWAMVTEDRSILDALLLQRNFPVRKQIQEIFRRVDDMRRLKITIAFLAGFALFAIVAMNLGGWLLSWVVHRVPARYEIEIGEKAATEVAEELEFVEVAPTNAIRAELVRLLGKELSERYPVKVAVYQDFLPNAFVIPGGHFYVSTGLLDLAEKPEELAGVLAHEAAHLKRRHGLRVLISEQGHGFMFKWIFGGNRNLISSMSSAADLLVGLTYSRELEKEADDEGWEMLLAANIDPRGLISMFEKLGSLDPSDDAAEGPSLLRTHPPTKDRIERLRKKWENGSKKDGFVSLQKIDWKKSERPALDLLDLLRENRRP